MIVVDQRNTRAPSSVWRPFVPKRPRSWGLEIAMVLAFVAWTVPLFWASPMVELDIWLRDLSDANRPEWAFHVAVWANRLGQGTPLAGAALGLAALIGYRRRSVRPLIAWMAVFLMTGSALAIKYVLTRVYPYWPERGDPPYANAEQATLFTVLEPSGAYPSGHAINAIVWYGLIILLAGRVFKTWLRRLFVLAPPIVTTISMTYLGFHWFTDAPAGLFFGIAVLRIVQRIPWETVELPRWLEPEKRYL